MITESATVQLIKNLGKKGVSLFDHILDICFFLGAAILAFIMLAVCWDVIARAVANKPLSWVLEVTEYSLLYMCFLSTASVLKDEKHVISDLLVVRMSRKNRAFLDTITSVVGAAVCMILTWFGASVSLDKLLTGAYQPTAHQPPDFPLFVIIPLGCFLLTLQFLRRARRNFRIFKNGTAADVEPTDELMRR